MSSCTDDNFGDTFGIPDKHDKNIYGKAIFSYKSNELTNDFSNNLTEKTS